MATSLAKQNYYEDSEDSEDEYSYQNIDFNDDWANDYDYSDDESVKDQISEFKKYGYNNYVTRNSEKKADKTSESEGFSTSEYCYMLLTVIVGVGAHLASTT